MFAAIAVAEKPNTVHISPAGSRKAFIEKFVFFGLSGLAFGLNRQSDAVRSAP
jgi:hypothetical protein